MASKIGVITLSGPDYIVELGTAISVTNGPSVQLKNLGPSTAWLTEIYAGDSSQSPPGASNAWPLAIGESVTITLPEYPVSEDTRVPGVVSDASSGFLAYIVEGV